MRRWPLIGCLLLGLWCGAADAARLTLRTAAGLDSLSAELGTQILFEVHVDPEGEEMTGVVFFVGYDAETFELVPGAAGEPFESGPFLGGIALVNSVTPEEDEVVLGYAEAAGVERRAATEAGVVARFRLEAKRRTAVGEVPVRLLERGHDRVSHYAVAGLPGREWRFDPPLGQVQVRVTGFRIGSLPDLELIEGEEKVVFDLDEFVEVPTDAPVLWTASRLSEIPATIDPRSNEVTMRPQVGFVGERRMVFTALETGEGLTAADTVRLVVVDPPQIVDFPPSVTFAEDGSHAELDLDAFGRDLDDATEDLVWSVAGGQRVLPQIDPNSRIVRFEADADWFGSEELVFSVADPAGHTASVRLLVEVTPVNDGPQAIRRAPVYPVVGGPILAIPVSELVEDIDDAPEALTFELDAEDGVEAEVSDGVMRLVGVTPGRAVVRYTVRDASGAATSDRLVTVVLGPDGGVAPQISPLPDLRFVSGTTGQLELGPLASDDGPPEALVWRLASAADDSLLVRTEGSRLVANAASGFIGSRTLLLEVADAEGRTDRAPLQVEVLAPEASPGPQLVLPAFFGLAIGDSLQLDLDELVVDADGDAADITWSIQAAQGLETSFDAAARRLVLRAPAPVNGGFVTFLATDAAGNSAEASVDVLVAAAGDPPEVRPQAEVVLEDPQAEARLDLDDFAFDADDTAAELEWFAVAEPGVSARVDAANHLIRLQRLEVTPPVETSQVLLRVRDTDGLERSVLIQVQLPPLFELAPLPAVSFFAGQEDQSLVLDDFIVRQVPGTQIRWTVDAGENVIAEVDPQTSRLRLSAGAGNFQGIETLVLRARDEAGRQRLALLEVTVKGQGLVPQIRPFPVVELRDGDSDSSIDLDDFVIDDDDDDSLVWNVLAPPGMEATIDPETRVVTLTAGGAGAGVARLEFSVRDAAGNIAVQVLEVQVRRGGEPPVIAVLPQLLVNAGGAEMRLGLDLYVEDADTPDADVVWQVEAGPGVVARVVERQLFVSVPAGQQGDRTLTLVATDPQGNRSQAQMRIIVQTDNTAPAFRLAPALHPVLDEIQLQVLASEALAQLPLVDVEGIPLQVEQTGERQYSGRYRLPADDRLQQLRVLVEGQDAAGNRGRQILPLSLRRLDRAGSLHHENGRIALNVPAAAAGPGTVALIYRLPAAEEPPDTEGQSVYAVSLGDRDELPHPVTVHFSVPEGEELGILRWDPQAGQWEELDTVVELDGGWLTAVVDRVGLFRVGKVAPGARRTAVHLTLYPNPVPLGGRISIVYQLDQSGPARLAVYNILGQRLRLLVDQPAHEGGTWTAQWDGLDAQGRSVASGIYYVELNENGRRRLLAVTVVR